jgi:glycogen debranching enzyme
LGTVWPHDNSLIAWGLTRYGYRQQERLPEAFAGYRRDLTRFPVRYPTACSPQAWASGAPLLLLRAMLGLEPIGNRLLVDSALPTDIGWLQLLDIPGAWGRTDAFGRGRVEIPS